MAMAHNITSVANSNKKLYQHQQIAGIYVALGSVAVLASGIMLTTPIDSDTFIKYGPGFRWVAFSMWSIAGSVLVLAYPRNVASFLSFLVAAILFMAVFLMIILSTYDYWWLNLELSVQYPYSVSRVGFGMVSLGCGCFLSHKTTYAVLLGVLSTGFFISAAVMYSACELLNNDGSMTYCARSAYGVAGAGWTCFSLLVSLWLFVGTRVERNSVGLSTMSDVMVYNRGL